MRASKTRVVLVLFLIGLEGVSRHGFVNQSQRLVKQNQKKSKISFDNQLKTALLRLINQRLLSLQ